MATSNKQKPALLKMPEPRELAAPDCEAFYTRRKKSEAARDLVDLCNRAMVENGYRATRAYRYGSHFQGYTLTNLSSFGADVSVTDGNLLGWDSPLIKNRLPQLAKSFVAKSFANDSPEPQFTTKGGDYEQILKGETLDQLIKTEFCQNHGSFDDAAALHRHGAMIAVTATGSYAIFCIDYDNAIRPELELDDTLTLGVYRAQQFGGVRVMVRTVWLLPEEAIRRFGNSHRDAIYGNVEPRTGEFVVGRPGGDLAQSGTKVPVQRREVRVHMGWAVQVGGEVGRQMFCLKDETILRDKPYTKPKPPGRIWHFEPELGGEWGTPLTQRMFLLSRYQNRILNDVDTAERKTSQVIIAVQKGTQGKSAVDKSQIVNSKAVSIIDVDGPLDSVMKVFEMPKFSKDSLALEQVYDSAQFEDTGIPRNHALAEGARGATSGLQESLKASYYTENFAEAERRSIHFRAIETTEIMLWVLQSLADKGFERWIGNKDFRRLVKSVDLDLDEDKYILEIKAVGEGTDTPAARLEKAEKWLTDPSVEFNGGNMVEMYKTYDDKAAEKRAYWIQSWVRDQVQRWRKAPQNEMRKPEFYQPPERWMQLAHLKTALEVVSFEYLNARMAKLPDERLAWFEKFANECVELIKQEQVFLASLGPGGGSAPGGGGGGGDNAGSADASAPPPSAVQGMSGGAAEAGPPPGLRTAA